MKRLTLIIALLSASVLGLGWIIGGSKQPLEVVATSRANVWQTEDPSLFLANQVALLAESHPDSMEPSVKAPHPLPEASEPAVQTQDLADQFPNGLMSIDNDSLPKFEESDNPDDLHLRRAASEFAYVEFKGVIGGRPLATFCIDPKSGDCKVAGEGDTFREVQVAKVDPGAVLLTYKSAAPIKKPLVQLAMDYKPMNQLTPEEVEIRKLRYQELYGNRLQEASLDYRKRNGGKVLNPPSSEEQQIAAEVYEQTYGDFFRDMQNGKPNEDSREYPPEAPTLEENVAEYFDTYWPNQVDWEVTDEELNGGE